MYYGAMYRSNGLPGQLIRIITYDYDSSNKFTTYNKIYADVCETNKRIKRSVYLTADLPFIREYKDVIDLNPTIADKLLSLIKLYTRGMEQDYVINCYILLCLIHRVDEVREAAMRYDLFISEKCDSLCPSFSVCMVLYKCMVDNELLHLFENGVITDDLHCCITPEKLSSFVTAYMQLNLL